MNRSLIMMKEMRTVRKVPKMRITGKVLQKMKISTNLQKDNRKRFLKLWPEHDASVSATETSLIHCLELTRIPRSGT